MLWLTWGFNKGGMNAEFETLDTFTLHFCDFFSPAARECNPDNGATELLFPILCASGKPADLCLPPHHFTHPRGLRQLTSAEPQWGETCWICKVHYVFRQRENNGTEKRIDLFTSWKRKWMQCLIEEISWSLLKCLNTSIKGIHFPVQNSHD